MSRILTIIALSAFLVFVIFQIYVTFGRYKEASALHQEALEKLEQASVSVSNLEADLDFFSRPENFEKEIRARFNYKFPEEETIILVPRKATSSDLEE